MDHTDLLAAINKLDFMIKESPEERDLPNEASPFGRHPEVQISLKIAKQRN